MKFTFEVGELEKHQVEFSFNQLLGSLCIKVDGQPVCSNVRLFNEPVLEVFDLAVGRGESRSVRIEKERKPLFGHLNRLYVDNRLVRVIDGF